MLCFGLLKLLINKNRKVKKIEKTNIYILIVSKRSIAVSIFS